ncbi:MAG: recombinase RecT [Muribaculaceae bacterium]|nr:recombinase RecT [Muribaculaceae bacterium]
MTAQNQTAVAENKAVAKFENISEQVLNKIEKFQADGTMTLPANYSVENHMKSAWLILQSTKDRDGRPALQVCTKESIANSLLDMVLQGLSVSKNQGYFIVYGNRLEFQRSYFGTVALAKRTGGIKKEPVANVIYEGDDFVYSIDPNTAGIKIIKHEQKIENIDNTKIKAAYALVTLADGTTQVTIMSMQQIRAAWSQGATKGNSPAHKNFAEEMAKKTVIGRACKMIINSSDDAWLYDGKADEMDIDVATKQRDTAVASSKAVVDTQEAEYEDVTEVHTAPTAPTAPAQTPNTDDEPGY